MTIERTMTTIEMTETIWAVQTTSKVNYSKEIDY